METGIIISADLDEIRKLSGNDYCADCGLKDPTWAAYNLGIFICDWCAKIHKDLGSQISRVKSIWDEDWDEDQLRMLRANGNTKCKLHFEQDVPLAYRRPRPSDLPIIKEQWIRGKYERLDFVGNCILSGTPGRKTGILWKKGKTGLRFAQRRFVLDMSDNSLSYFIHDQSKSPKASFPVSQLNVTLVPKKVGNPFAMQLMVKQSDNSSRSIYIYADSGQELIEWYTALRTARLKCLCYASPMLNISELSHHLSRDFIKEGWLHKAGPRPRDAYRRRWITLDENTLYYYEEPLDPFPKGKVIIWCRHNGFTVREDVPPGFKPRQFAFTLKTPNRNYCFGADSETEMKEWTEALLNITRNSVFNSDDRQSITSFS